MLDSKYYILIIVLNLIYLLFHNKISKILNIYDKPDKLRKFHKKITPMTGGFLIFLNLFIYSLIFYLNFDYDNNLSIYFNDLNEFLIFFLTCFSLFALGIIDDKFNIPSNKKFLFLIIIILPGLILCENLLIENVRLSFLNQTYSLQFFSIFWTILCFLLFINAFNMFDGINLQTSIYSLFICCNLIFFNGYDFLILALIFSLLSFIFLNIQSKSFFGDGGTYLLSYIFGYLFIKSYNQNGDIFADQIVLIMLLPGLELMRLFTIRIASKKNPFFADRNHLHHILLKKNNFLRVTLITQSLIILPFMFSLLIGFTIGFIFLALILYSIIIFKYTQ